MLMVAANAWRSPCTRMEQSAAVSAIAAVATRAVRAASGVTCEAAMTKVASAARTILTPPGVGVSAVAAAAVATAASEVDAAAANIHSQQETSHYQ